VTTLTLERYCYSETETEGIIKLPNGKKIYTLERPWRTGAPGGVPFESSVPDGSYKLISHIRPNGDEVLALWNPDNSVYYTDQERAGQPGRYLILIHAANWVEQIVGCIAPGMVRTIADNKRMVRSSREAMSLIMAAEPKRLKIVPALGAKA
jgi:hypothetical protein